MTQADVQKFAASNGLPQAYVEPFFSSMTALASKTGSAGQDHVPYHVFDSYVSSRERALKRIFDKLDHGACLLSPVITSPCGCLLDTRCITTALPDTALKQLRLNVYSLLVRMQTRMES